METLETLQQQLMSPPILPLPRRNERYTLDTHGCDKQVRCIILQYQPEGQAEPVGTGPVWETKMNRDTTKRIERVLQSYGPSYSWDCISKKVVVYYPKGITRHIGGYWTWRARQQSLPDYPNFAWPECTNCCWRKMYICYWKRKNSQRVGIPKQAWKFGIVSLVRMVNRLGQGISWMSRRLASFWGNCPYFRQAGVHLFV